MPYNYMTSSLVPAPTSGMALPGGFGGAVSSVLSGIGSALGVGGAAGALGGIGSALGLGVPFVDIAPTGGAAIFEPYRESAGGYRAQNFIAPDPGTGALRWFGPKGKPLLWSSDLQAARRVGKLAARAGRYVRRPGVRRVRRGGR